MKPVHEMTLDEILEELSSDRPSEARFFALHDRLNEIGLEMVDGLPEGD